MDMTVSTKEFLYKIPFFLDHPTEEVEILTRAIYLVTYKAGEVIFEEGSIGDSMCFLVEGSVEILKKDKNNNNRSYAILYPPCIFGEMSIIDNNIRSATIVANSDVEIATLSKTDFDIIMNNYPRLSANLLKKVSRILSSRLRKANNKFVEFL